MKLVLPIFFYTDAIQKLKDAGMDYEITDCLVSNVTFYNISAIAPYIEHDKKTGYSIIYIGCDSFICKLHPVKLEQLIDDTRTSNKEV